MITDLSGDVYVSLKTHVLYHINQTALSKAVKELDDDKKSEILKWIINTLLKKML